MTMTLIPAYLHSLMASMTSLRGGSNIPTTPTNVQLVYNSLESGETLRAVSGNANSALNKEGIFHYSVALS